MNCDVILERNRRIIRFTKDGGKINKSAICYIIDVISSHYIKPETFIHQKGVDLIVVSKNSTKLDFIASFVTGILLPRAQNSCSCDKCSTKRRPSFCTHKKQ